MSDVGERLDRALSVRTRALLVAAIAVLAAVAALKLQIEVWHAIWNPNDGAKDLGYFRILSQDWADGGNPYDKLPHPYPPGSLPVLYAIAGWLDWPQVRLLMATLNLCGAALLIGFAWRATAPRSAAEALLVALLLASTNGAGTALGNGQLALVVVPLVLTAVLVLQRRPVAWLNDLLAAACLTLALVKPTITVPFVWLAMIQPDAVRWRPLLLAAAGYAGLTVFALWVMDEPVIDMLLTSVRIGTGLAADARDPNLHFVLAKLGFQYFQLVPTAAALLWLGAWVYFNRRSDLWILLGVTALVARGWTYHRHYDDVLLYLPEIALWRIATTAPDERGGRIAAALLALNVLVILAPGQSADVPLWLQRAATVAQAIVWPTTLALLLLHASRARDERKVIAVCAAQPT